MERGVADTDLQRNRPTRIRFRVLAWLVSAAAIAYLCRNAVGVAESSIRADLGLSLSQSGWFMGMFFWTYAVCSIPSGVLSHRWGSRLALGVFAMVWSLATAAIGMAPAAAAGFIVLLVAQLANGVAQAGIFPASTGTIASWIPVGQRTTACAVLTLGMQLGAVVAASLTGHLLGLIEWRWIFLCYAVPGIAWAVSFYATFRDDPARDERVNREELDLIRGTQDVDPEECSDAARRPDPTPWRALAGNRAMWMLCGQQVFRAAGYMFFASWFPTFLQRTRGVSKATSGDLQAAVLVATIVGALVGGVLTDWVWRRTGSLRLSRSGIGALFLFLSGIFIWAAYLADSLRWSMVLICLGAMMASLGGVGAIAATMDIGGRYVPQVFAVMNMAGNFAAAGTPVYVGYIFEYSDNWDQVLILFALIYFAGAAFWILVDPNEQIDGTVEIHTSGHT